MKKYPLTLTFSSILTMPVVSHVKFKGGFANIGVYYLGQTSRITEKSSTKPYGDGFGYPESKGGVNFSWGEMYGSLDWKNFYNGRHNKPGSEQRYTFKDTNRTYLGDTESNLYLYACGTYGFANRVSSHSDMFLYGTGYDFTNSGWWFRPSFAKHYTDQTYYTGDNGYVAGWAAGYNFMLGSEKFTPISWSEREFDCDATYAVGNGGKEGLNGTVALWRNATSHITAGIRYRYTDGKLGEDFYQDAVIYSIESNF